MKVSPLTEDITRKLNEDVLRAMARNESLLDNKAEKAAMMMLTAVAIIDVMASLEMDGSMPAWETRDPNIKCTTFTEYFMARCADVTMLARQMRQANGLSI